MKDTDKASCPQPASGQGLRCDGRATSACFSLLLRFSVLWHLCLVSCREMFPSSLSAYVQLLRNSRQCASRAAQTGCQRRVRTNTATATAARGACRCLSLCSPYVRVPLSAPHYLLVVSTASSLPFLLFSVPKKLVMKHRDDAVAVFEKLAASLRSVACACARADNEMCVCRASPRTYETSRSCLPLACALSCAPAESAVAPTIR